ncbi:uncharacterized protein BKA78DRAFT_70171 [Phyllosticta capitalensis]|uniref:Uncharacterized protein n=1 Tax=Phyllosticta capitalensis TaxID=121624 RepID=A0ABR1YZ09_9PEZI
MKVFSFSLFSSVCHFILFLLHAVHHHKSPVSTINCQFTQLPQPTFLATQNPTKPLNLPLPTPPSPSLLQALATYLPSTRLSPSSIRPSYLERKLSPASSSSSQYRDKPSETRDSAETAVRRGWLAGLVCGGLGTCGWGRAGFADLIAWQGGRHHEG